MEKVEGYLADDGTFFQTAEDAELYEARAELIKQLGRHGVDSHRAIEFMIMLQSQIKRFFDAKDADTRSAAILAQLRDGSFSLGRDDPEPIESTPAPILEQSSGSGEPMPHVGDSILSEEISNDRAIARSRSRERDA